MITRDEWLSALKTAGDDRHEHEDDREAVTVMEFAALVGCTVNPARRRLELLCRKGLAERTHKKYVDGLGREQSFRAYRLRKDADEARQP